MSWRWLPISLIILAAPAAVSAQSLFILQGERAMEGSAGWSVGPFSQGVELTGGLSLDGRWDVGFGVHRYDLDLGGTDEGTLTEWTPFVRYFLFKERDDAAPVSLAAQAQLFRDDFGGGDSGWTVLAGGQLYKTLTLAEGWALHPYVGFALTGESHSFGERSERSVYLTRQFGVQGQFAVGTGAWVRVSAEEQSFRRETFRAVRVSYVRRY